MRWRQTARPAPVAWHSRSTAVFDPGAGAPDGGGQDWTSSVPVTISGKAPTLDSQNVDHPVTITAHAAGFADGTAAISDADPIVQFGTAPATARTTNSPPQDITVNVLNPKCLSCGDV